MSRNFHRFVIPKGDAQRAALELLIREDFERCHPDEKLEDMKRRMPFSKENRGLYRDWLAVAVARASAPELLAAAA
jgi:hypothetical protein